MTKRVRIAILVLVLAGAGLWWWLAQQPAETVWQGYAEADYVKVGPTQQGLLTAVSVARGDLIAAGAPLFTQDETADRAARDQSARQVGEAEAQLGNLQAGGKPTEIEQAEANLADAGATLARTKIDLERGEKLLPHGAIAAQQVDQMRAAYKSAEARVQATSAALDQMRRPLGRDTEIAAQRAAAAAAHAALEVAEWRLAQRRVTAPVGGRVADVLARPGETMAAGAPVVSLLPPENMLVRFFVSETDLASVHRGDAVALKCDGCPPNLAATISFIGPQAEYTPPVIYSESSRAKLVYLIEAHPRPDQAVLLNPGEPVEVRPTKTGNTH